MAATHLGKEGALRSTKIENRPGRGLFVERIFTGSEAYIYGIFNSLASDQSAMIDDTESPLFKLYVRTPDVDDSTEPQLTTTWELLGNHIEKDIFEHPLAVALDAAVIRSIQKLLDDPGSPVPTTPAWNADANLLYELAEKGTTKWISSHYVLRRTQLVSTRYQSKIGFLGIHKLWPTALLTSTEIIPATLLFDIAQIPPPTVLAGFLFSWLKQTPTVTQGVNGKWQMTNEWWLESWSTWLYQTQV